jgi:hypothetical protein
MTKKTYLQIAALVIALVPSVASAQSIDGYQIPSAPRTSAQPAAADQMDLSVPGDGYKIVPAPRGPQPLAADTTDLSVPGDGYRIYGTSPAPLDQSTTQVSEPAN